ncbi:Protein SERAC1 [Cytospora mali]|uniref:Protein SERAC1 n=1 Tax=Cytospora mali TaxID=578113 RepID=A0A194WA74_CYTMA|nr:Protein SERAC1 [Valsa mali]
MDDPSHAFEPTPPPLAATTTSNSEMSSSTGINIRRSPAFVARDPAAGGRYATSVDVVLVPCPGADPHDTWTRDRLPSDVFESTFDWDELQIKVGIKRAPRLHPDMFYHNDKWPSWTQSGIRNEVEFARVLTYDHGDISADTTIKELAENLLKVLRENRSRRPLFLICHSLGGLVVKMALTEARHQPDFQEILKDCYGVTFFATPHRGSPYLSQSQTAERMRQLLGLTKPLPTSIVAELRPDHDLLLKIDAEFRTISSEVHIWSLYETGTVQLSEDSVYGSTDAQIKVPLTSIRSAILGLRRERIYPLQNSHANCASFGMKNLRTMRMYLKDLGGVVRKVDTSWKKNSTSTSLQLEQNIWIQVHAFYGNSGPQSSAALRVYSTEITLENFLTEFNFDHRQNRHADPRTAQGGATRNECFQTGTSTGRGDRHTEQHWTVPSTESMMAAASHQRTSRCGHLRDRSSITGLLNSRRPSWPSSQQVDNSTRPFVWIHQCLNNPAWVMKTFETLSIKEKADFSQLLDSKHWQSKQEGRRHSQPHAWFLKPSCDFVPLDARPSEQTPSKSHLPNGESGSGGSLNGCIYLYMPFLHFDTYKAIIKRRRLITKRLSHGLKKPIPVDVIRETSRELKTIWEYLDHDPPINIRRTLDQFQHPSLFNTKARDDDQVLYKMTKERFETFGIVDRTILPSGSNDLASDDEDAIESWTNDLDEMTLDKSQSIEYDEEEESDILNGNILMVDQLWLWAIDMGHVVTCFPKREEEPMDGPLFNEADLHNSILNELHGDVSTPCSNALDLAALTVLHTVTVLLGRSSNPDLEVFRLFEEAISLLTERMTRLLNVLEASSWDGGYGFGGDLTDVKIPIHEKHRLENARARLENRTNTSTLLALRNIEDELSIMRRLFSEQEQQIKNMLHIYESIRESKRADLTTTPIIGESYLQEALTAVQSYQDRTDDMIIRTRKVLLDFDRLLDLLERRAQGEEGRLSRHHADLGAAQNRIVLIFTVFTVIFLPLSFFTSLFGMNTQEWSGGNNLSLKTIGLIVLPSSAFLIVCAIAGAWIASGSTGFPSMDRYTRMPMQWCKKTINLVMYGDSKPRTNSARRRLLRKAETPEQRRRKERMKRDVLMLDFWDSRRLQREYDNRIPLGNRKSVRIAMAKSISMKEDRKGQRLS